MFWQSPPVALWNTVGRELADRHDLDTADQARFCAMFNLAAVDGAISCWNDRELLELLASEGRDSRG